MPMLATFSVTFVGIWKLSRKALQLITLSRHLWPQEISFLCAHSIDMIWYCHWDLIFMALLRDLCRFFFFVVWREMSNPWNIERTLNEYHTPSLFCCTRAAMMTASSPSCKMSTKFMSKFGCLLISILVKFSTVFARCDSAPMLVQHMLSLVVFSHC